mmetsp:Transcript_101529/g.201657  ORF Transcript_101529/g.201657 Transcript_101529/m.201657 type:complete len:85 (+) Transcript_101529:231-485(+)
MGWEEDIHGNVDYTHQKTPANDNDYKDVGADFVIVEVNQCPVLKHVIEETGLQHESSRRDHACARCDERKAAGTCLCCFAQIGP